MHIKKCAYIVTLHSKVFVLSCNIVSVFAWISWTLKLCLNLPASRFNILKALGSATDGPGKGLFPIEADLLEHMGEHPLQWRVVSACRSLWKLWKTNFLWLLPSHGFTWKISPLELTGNFRPHLINLYIDGNFERYTVAKEMIKHLSIKILSKTDTRRQALGMAQYSNTSY